MGANSMTDPSRFATSPPPADEIRTGPNVVPSRIFSEPPGMTEPRPRSRRFDRLVRRKAFWAAVSVPLSIAAVSGWLTADLEPPPVEISTVPTTKPVVPPPRVGLPDWPTTPMTGREATAQLLDSLKAARAKIEQAG